MNDKLLATNDRINLLWIAVFVVTVGLSLCIVIMLARQDRIERKVDAIQGILTAK
jgi:hypothetical protein